MVRGRAQGRGEPVENPNSEFMSLLLNIQRRLDEHAAMMQQQAEMIQNLQLQQGRVADHELEGSKDKDLNMDPGNLVDGGNDHGGNGAEDPPIGAPRGFEPGLRGNPQP